MTCTEKSKRSMLWLNFQRAVFCTVINICCVWICIDIIRTQCTNLETDDNGGWLTNSSLVIAGEGPCNIEIRDVASLSQFEFLERYAYDAPVVIRLSKTNRKIHEMSERSVMLEKYGHNLIRLSTANTHSYNKVDVTLRYYIEELLRPQSLDTLGNETFYWFGDNNYAEWQELFDSYEPPPYNLPGKQAAYSYGVAGPGTGVPFHFHGPGFAEVLFGRKRWFLYPPKAVPVFHPNRTALQWLVDDYSKLSASRLPLECTVHPGEVIYFPDRWWHSTLNIDTSAFISTFLG